MDANERNRLQKIMSETEQKMQDIVENRRNKLDEFIFSDSQYHVAVAYISYALAHHFALKGLNDET